MKSLPALLLVAVIIFLPTDALAQVQGLANVCSGPDCSACNLVDLGNRLITWLIGVITILFAVLMVVAGFGLITSGGNQSALQAAKSKFTNALIGFMIVLAAWLLIDTLMRGLIGNNGNIAGWGPWSEVQCWSQTAVAALPPAVIANSSFSDPTSPVAGSNVVSTIPCAATPNGNQNCQAVLSNCPSGTTGVTHQVNQNNSVVNCVNVVQSTPGQINTQGCQSGSCVSLSSNGVPCKNASSCSVASGFDTALTAMHQAAGVSGARVTEAMPPTRQHKASCHQNGTCVDYSVAGGMSASQVSSVVQAANANGLRAVYEVSTTREKQNLVSAGVPAANIAVLGSWISAPHFSVYAN